MSAADLSPLGRRLAGLASLALLGTVGWAATALALGSFTSPYHVRIVLGELAQGLTSGSDVKIRGVLVGQVSDVTLDKNLQAVATLKLNNSYRVPTRSTYTLTSKTLLGEKQVEVRFDGPFDQGPFLADGTLTSDPKVVVEVTDVVAELSDLLGAVDPDDLATLVDDGLGALDGQGRAIARVVDQGARATDVLARSLDDQTSSVHDLSLVAERLGPEGAQLNRLAQSLVDGLPTISDNQAKIDKLLVQLSALSRTLHATFTVNRPDIDRIIVQGDNVTRLLFDYSKQVGQVASGLVQYTENFGPGFRAPGLKGQGGRFVASIDQGVFAGLCDGLPPELSTTLPLCAGNVALPSSLVKPEVPTRGGLSAVARQSLNGMHR
ncbi:MAG: MlaD family protein [Egibacteraceae bacterium]